MATVHEAARRALQHHRHELQGSLVYVDAGAAEVLACALGADALTELGAAALVDLSAASPADLPAASLLSGGAPVRRVALLISSLLAQAEAAVLAACRQCAGAAQFTVLSGASEAAHHDEAPSTYGAACFAATAAGWQQALNAERRSAGLGPCSLALLHCPLLLCPVSAAAFVLPTASAAAALPHAGHFAAGYSTSAAAADSDDDDQPAAAAAAAHGGGGAAPASGLALLAHSLVAAMAALGHRPEAFALGPCARQVSRAMAYVPAPEGDLPPAALVLVDRLLDPVSPAVHADLLVQRLYDRLAPPAGTDGSGSGGGVDSGSGGSGASVMPFTPLCCQLPMPRLDPPAAPEAAAAAAAAEGGARDDSALPGSLQHPSDAQAEHWLQFLLGRKGRDGPLFVRKWLREAARKENVPQAQRVKPGASISASELRALAGGLRGQSLATAQRHAPLLQLAEAAAAAVEGTHAERWDALAREERQLLFACAESAEAAASHLAELCSLLAGAGGGGGGGGDKATPQQAQLGLGDVALLCLAAYFLLPDLQPARYGGAAGFTPQQEERLREALVEASMATGGASAGSAGSQGPAWPLEHLAARVAMARHRSADGSGAGAAGAAGAEVLAEELQGLRLEARDAADALLVRMRQLGGFRRSLQLRQLGRLAAVGGDGAPRHTPLLRQIAEHVLADEPLPDLSAGATSLTALLRSGLGRFGLQAGPKPSDCPTVVLFVIGGVSISELHEVQQAVDERAAQAAQAAQAAAAAAASGGGGGGPRAPPRVLVGGTALLRHADLCRHLFADLSAA